METIDKYEKERNDPYITWFNGEPVGRLNERLAIRQKVTPEQLKNLVDLHQKKDAVFAEMRATDDKPMLHALAVQVTAIELELQENWNFPPDPSYHEWYTVPKCKCPYMDNAGRRGIPAAGRIINTACPVHGDLT